MHATTDLRAGPMCRALVTRGYGAHATSSSDEVFQRCLESDNARVQRTLEGIYCFEIGDDAGAWQSADIELSFDTPSHCLSELAASPAPERKALLQKLLGCDNVATEQIVAKEVCEHPCHALRVQLLETTTVTP